MKRILIFLVIGLVFLVGCVEETPKQASNDFAKQVVIIPSCDDGDVCTEDVFNNLTQQCDHVEMEFCCGDGVCSGGERCDAETHRTVCPDDCPMECPAVMVLGEWDCSGKCLEGPGYYLIDGDAILNVTLENIGELNFVDVASGFRCNKESTGNLYVSDMNIAPKNGVLFRHYFDNGEEKVYLSGAPYDRNKVNFILDLEGVPEEEMDLNCFVTFRTISESLRGEFRLRLLPSQ